MKNILWLNELSKKKINLAGGKGAQLGELYNARFPVPNAFVITSLAYKHFVKNISLDIERLNKTNINHTKLLEETAKRIQKKILSASFPSDLKQEIVSAYSKLGGKVAIRSSATAEDLPTASFAGLQETFLNIEGNKKVLDAIKACFASLFTARAIFYRVQNKFDHAKVLMAVVVQKMVTARKAGVVFSINTITNNKTELVIEAVSGLGESLVSGLTTPDSYLINKKTKKIKEKHILKKEILSNKELSSLIDLASKIEKHYKFPQDIEWAIDKKVHIVQSRPVTTSKYLYSQAKWKEILSREYGVQYTEISLRCLTSENKDLVPYTFYEQIYIPEDGNEVCYIDANKWKNLILGLEKTWNANNIKKFENKFIKTGNEYVNFSRKIPKNLRSKSNKALKKVYLQYQKHAIRYTSFIWTAYILNNVFSEKARQVIHNYLGKKESQKYYGIIFSPTKEASIIKLASLINKIPKINSTSMKKLHDEYKWISCLDIHNPPWTINQFVSHAKQLKKDKQVSELQYQSFLKKFKIKQKDKHLFDITKRFAYIKDLRDDFRRKAVFYAQSTLFNELARRMNLKLKDISYFLEREILDFLDRNIVSKNYINWQKGFVIFFDNSKKINCAGGKDVKITMRKLGISTKESYLTEIKGVPASKGLIEGKVTIVKGVKDLLKVKKGDILVAVTTHPDYVPAMQKASAIVTDEGGITSHAAIVARELGVPCIVGTKKASKILKDNDKVEVDANIGFVRKLK